MEKRPLRRYGESTTNPKARTKTANATIDIAAMEQQLNAVGLKLGRLAKITNVSLSTLQRLKIEKRAKQDTVDRIKEGFALLTNSQSQFVTVSENLELGSTIPAHPEYDLVSGSNFNQHKTTETGIGYYQIELTHKKLEGVRGRGKLYNLFAIPANEREKCFHQVTRHAEVCRKIASSPLILPNLSALPFSNLEGLWVVDQWFDGELLMDKIQEVREWPLQSKKKMIAQILEALTLIHDCGIVLRVLDPSTILVNDMNREIKLTNFELAKIVNHSKSVAKNKIWRENMYLAPEVSKYVDATVQNDIFSVGILARELFKSEIDDGIAIKGLSDFVSKATETLPTMRFSNAKQAAVDWANK